MTSPYAPAVRTTRMLAVRDAADAGSGAAVLQICTAGFAVVLATVPLNDPCGTVAGDVLTFSGMPRSDMSADATGTAAVARIRDSAGGDVISPLNVTLAGGGGQVILDSLAIAAGQEVRITSATITHG